MLSNRVRPDVEAAPWVIDEIKKLEAENAKLRDALKKAQGDINWMLNTKQFLSGFVFDYIDEAL